MTTEVILNYAAIETLLNSPAGPVARHLVGITERVQQRAKVRAPVGPTSKDPRGHPSGYLRSQIKWSFVPGRALCTKVESNAITSAANVMPGENYGLQQEVPRLQHKGLPASMRGHGPYLVPALHDVFAAL